MQVGQVQTKRLTSTWRSGPCSDKPEAPWPTKFFSSCGSCGSWSGKCLLFNRDNGPGWLSVRTKTTKFWNVVRTKLGISGNFEIKHLSGVLEGPLTPLNCTRDNGMRARSRISRGLKIEKAYINCGRTRCSNKELRLLPVISFLLEWISLSQSVMSKLYER